MKVLASVRRRSYMPYITLRYTVRVVSMTSGWLAAIRGTRAPVDRLARRATVCEAGEQATHSTRL